MYFDCTFGQKLQLLNLVFYHVGLQCRTATALPAVGTLEAQCLDPSNLLPELTLGEKMSQILKDQTDQLTKEVKNSVSICILHQCSNPVFIWPINHSNPK